MTKPGIIEVHFDRVSMISRYSRQSLAFQIVALIRAWISPRSKKKKVESAEARTSRIAVQQQYNRDLHRHQIMSSIDRFDHISFAIYADTPSLRHP